MNTWGQALAWGLSELGGQEHITDVLRLLTDKTEHNLLAVYELSDKPYPELSEFKDFIYRRQQGEPVAYITGRQDFWRSSFLVNADVLIPRQDSELIVETLLELDPQSILELGVGSGAVIISYLLENKSCLGFASDISEAALAVAKTNSKLLSCPLEFRQGSWFAPWCGRKFDIIVANPPYIASNDPCLQSLKFEPSSALVSGQEGLADLFNIIEQAPKFLHSGGWLLLEHGSEQGKPLQDKLHEWPLSYCIPDINGKDRLTVAQVL